MLAHASTLVQLKDKWQKAKNQSGRAKGENAETHKRIKA
jgi:hypothetical protein